MSLPLSLRARLFIGCAALLLCIGPREAVAAVKWGRVGTVTTLTNGQLCKTDGTDVICDTTTPTISGSNVGIGSTAPVTSLDLSQMTDALALPSGGSAQRPTGGNLVNGEIRYNTGGTGNIEAYYNSAWNTLLTSATLGTSTPAAGSTGYVQFNSGGYLGASSSFFWDNTHGRVGIGTASPAQTLEVNGTTKIDTGLIVPLIYPATDGSPAIQFTNAAQSTTVFAIDTTNIRAGVGLTSIGANFQVHNPLTSSSVLRITNTTTGGAGTHGLDLLESGTDAYVYNRESGHLYFGTSNSTRMTVDSSGNVGIGTTSPLAPLSIFSSGGNDLSLSTPSANQTFGVVFRDVSTYKWQLFKDGGQNLGIYDYTRGANVFTIAPNGNMALMPSGGNVGIGTPSPGNTLDVRGAGNFTGTLGVGVTSNGYGAMLDVRNPGTSGILGYFANNGAVNIEGDSSGGGLFANTGSALGIYFYGGASGDAKIVTNSLDRLHITNAGNVGIGVTSPSYMLDVIGTLHAGDIITAQKGMYLTGFPTSWGTASVSAVGGEVWVMTPSGKNGYLGVNGTQALTWNSAGASLAGTFTTTGAVGIGTTSPGDTLTVNGTVGYMLGSDYTTTGSQNNVSLGAASAVRYNGAGTATFTGIAAGANGQILYLHNPSAYTLTLSNLSGSSSAANQIVTGTGAALPVPSNTSVTLQYDATASLWRVTGSSNAATSLPAGSNTQVQFNNAGAFGASSSFVWDNTNGRVGIGTTAPGMQVDIVGGNGFPATSGSTATGILRLRPTAGASGGTLDMGVDNSSGNGWLEATNFGSGGLADHYALVLNPYGGNVGIGTTAPIVSLDLGQKTDAIALPGGSNAQRPTGAALANGEIRYNNAGVGAIEAYVNGAWATLLSGSGGGSAAGSNGQVQFNNGGVLGADSGFFWDNTNKRLGIGTTSPAQLLDILAPAGTRSTIAEFEHSTQRNFYIEGQTGSGDIGATNGILLYTSGGNLGLRSGNSGNANILINTAGNVGIGTTSPAVQFHIVNPSAAYGTEQMRIGNGGTNEMALRMGVSSSSSFSWIQSTAINSSQAELAINPAGGNVVIGNSTGHGTFDVEGSYGIILNAGNVGIGTASPLSLLDISNTTQLSDRIRLSGQEYYQAGSTSTDGVVFRLGVNRGANRQLWIADSAASINATNAQLRFMVGSGLAYSRIDSISTDGTTATNLALQISGGNVGIGTTAPGAPLQIYNTASTSTNGLVLITSSSDDPFNIQNNAAASTWMHMGKLLAANAAATDNVVLEIGQASSSYNDGYIGFNYAGSGSANNYLTFGLNGVDHVLNITGSGNVGIGTTAPITMLTIGANSNTTTRYQQAFQSYSNTISYPQILLNNPGANYLGVGFDTAGNLAFGTATAANANWANEYLVMSQSGNVGIGSTSPQGTLDVEGGTAASGNGSTINLAAQNGQASGNTNGGNIILTPGTAHGTGTGGAVGIGSASPAAGMKADIAGPVKVAGSGSETCTAATYGAIRYNQAGGYFEVCSP